MDQADESGTQWAEVREASRAKLAALFLTPAAGTETALADAAAYPTEALSAAVRATVPLDFSALFAQLTGAQVVSRERTVETSRNPVVGCTGDASGTDAVTPSRA